MLTVIMRVVCVCCCCDVSVSQSLAIAVASPESHFPGSPSNSVTHSGSSSQSNDSLALSGATEEKAAEDLDEQQQNNNPNTTRCDPVRASSDSVMIAALQDVVVSETDKYVRRAKRACFQLYYTSILSLYFTIITILHYYHYTMALCVVLLDDVM